MEVARTWIDTELVGQAAATAAAVATGAFAGQILSGAAAAAVPCAAVFGIAFGTVLLRGPRDRRDPGLRLACDAVSAAGAAAFFWASPGLLQI
ncbi:hypothetical protein ACFPYM_02215 [Methylobacterium hispanicum]